MTPTALREAFQKPLGAAARAGLRSRHQALLVQLATEHLCSAAPGLNARRRLSGGQKRAVAVAALALLPVLVAAPRLGAVAANALFLFATLATLALRAALLSLSLGARPRPVPPPLRDEALPVVTVLCPAYREAAMLDGLMGALDALDYPSDRLDVKLLLEADDDETIARARFLSPRFELDVLIVPEGGPRTKPKACNHGLWSARGKLLVIYDAEDAPEPSQLRDAAAAFAAAPAEIVCLQARLNFRGWDRNWLTRMFAAEYALLFDLVLPGLDRLGAPLPLGGTSNVFRTDALIEVGGWDAYNVTEDADLGLRLAHFGYGARTLDSTTYEVPTRRVGAWVRQRSRWIKGYLQCWIVHTRRGPRRGQAVHALTLHLVVGVVGVAALLNPVFWVLYLGWLLVPGLDLAWLFPGPMAGLAALALLLGNAFQAWLFMLAPLRRGWLALVPYAVSAPLYWVLQSVAGYRAAAQLLTAPFYWEKTEHEPLAPSPSPITGPAAPIIADAAKETSS